MDQYDILDPSSLRKQGHPEFKGSLLDIADSVERHGFFSQNWESYVPGPPQFRGHATELGELGLGADRGDIVMKAERDAARERAQLSIDVAAKYMVIRAVEKKDPGLLHNTGIPLKQKQGKKGAKTVPGKQLPITLTAKHIKGKSRCALLEGNHTRNGGPYLLQICKGEPVSEESWYSPGGHYKSCRRIVVENLEEATKYYFRIRTDGPDGPGPWSQVVSLIIL